MYDILILDIDPWSDRLSPLKRIELDKYIYDSKFLYFFNRESIHMIINTHLGQVYV